MALQRDAFGYFLHETNPANGLVADKTQPDAPASIAAGRSLSSPRAGGVPPNGYASSSTRACVTSTAICSMRAATELNRTMPLRSATNSRSAAWPYTS